MAEDTARRIERLAARAQKLDLVIKRAAKMNKQIVDEIRRLSARDRMVSQRMTATLKRKRKKKKR